MPPEMAAGDGWNEHSTEGSPGPAPRTIAASFRRIDFGEHRRDRAHDERQGHE
jgi:hypothetical protein